MATLVTATATELRRRFRPRAMGRDDAARAYRLGWSVAQTDYLAREQDRARQAMLVLMGSRGLEPPMTTADAGDLIEIAVGLSESDGQQAGATQRRADGQLVISVVGCPVQGSPRAQAICSERVCPYWHRRQGWIEATGTAGEDVRLSRDEGLPGSCTSLIRLSAIPGAA
jgi:hypothetical protein